MQYRKKFIKQQQQQTENKKTTLWRNNALEWISVGLIFSVKCPSLPVTTGEVGGPVVPFFLSSLFHFQDFALTLMATGISNREAKGPFPWRYFCIYVWEKQACVSKGLIPSSSQHGKEDIVSISLFGWCLFLWCSGVTESTRCIGVVVRRKFVLNPTWTWMCVCVLSFPRG